ncbi:MAG: pilus assembly protein PilB, partial [Chthoniobacterales bacterium]
MNNNQVAELFLEQHVFKPSQLEDVLQEANLNGKSLAQTMVDNGLVDENGFYQTVAQSLGMDYVPLEGEIPPDVLR